METVSEINTRQAPKCGQIGRQSPTLLRLGVFYGCTAFDTETGTFRYTLFTLKSYSLCTEMCVGTNSNYMIHGVPCTLKNRYFTGHDGCSFVEIPPQ